MTTRAAPVATRALARAAFATRRCHQQHRACSRTAPRNARYPLHYPHPLAPSATPRPLSDPPSQFRASPPGDDSRAAPDVDANPRYDPDAILANPCGFLVTAQPGKTHTSRTTRAVDEARYILHAAPSPSALSTPLPELLGDPLPLYPVGSLGCWYLPARLTPEERAWNPLADLAAAALEEFVSEPLPPADTPEYLARLVPVERTCAATMENVVDAVREVLPRRVRNPTLEPRTALDPYAERTTYRVHFERHRARGGGEDGDLRAKDLEAAIAELLPGPDYAPCGDDPDVTVFVGEYHSVALVSALPRWRRLRGYNARALADDRAGTRAREEVRTTGQEGYP